MSPPLELRLRLGALPIRVHQTFWPIALVLGALHHGEAMPALAWTACLALTLFTTELAHAWAFVKLGYQPRISFHWLGAETWVAQARTVSVGRLCAAYLAGPAAGFALAIVALDLEALTGAQPILHDLGRIALVWSTASLLPIYPLSGGHVVRVLATKKLGARATDLAHGLSLLTLLALVPAGVAMLDPTLLVPIGLAMIVNISGSRQLALHRAEARIEARLVEGYQALRGDVTRAVTVAREMLRDARSAKVRAQAKQLLAWAFLVQKNYDACESTLRQLPAGHEPDAYLVGTLHLQRGEFAEAAVLLAEALEVSPDDRRASLYACALVRLQRLDDALALAGQPFAGPLTFTQVMAGLFYAGRIAEAATIGERSFAVKADALVAFNLACCACRLDKLDDAAGWLGRAVDCGWKDLQQLDSDPDLEPLRRHPGFHQARTRLTSLGRSM